MSVITPTVGLPALVLYSPMPLHDRPFESPEGVVLARVTRGVRLRQHIGELLFLSVVVASFRGRTRSS